MGGGLQEVGEGHALAVIGDGDSPLGQVEGNAGGGARRPTGFSWGEFSGGCYNLGQSIVRPYALGNDIACVKVVDTGGGDPSTTIEVEF
jgi:hypothetical protein